MDIFIDTTHAQRFGGARSHPQRSGSELQTWSVRTLAPHANRAMQACRQRGRRITTSMVPDDWLSDAENGTSKGIWSDFVQRINSFA